MLYTQVVVYILVQQWFEVWTCHEEVEPLCDMGLLFFNLVTERGYSISVENVHK